MCSIPRAHAPPLIGLLADFRRDPLSLLTQQRERYGDLFILPLGPRPLLVINEPRHIRFVLAHHGRGFVKGDDSQLAAPVLGGGVLLSEGERWRRQRALIRPAFNHDQLERYSQIMVRVADERTALWGQVGVFDLNEAMTEIAIAIATQCFFGAVSDETVKAVSAHTETARQLIIHRFRSLVRLPLSWPNARNRAFRRATSGLDTIIADLVASRRAAASGSQDLLDLLLGALDDSAEPTDSGELRDQAVNFLLAGSETTAATMTWTLYLLARHPEQARRAAAEIQSVLGRRVPMVSDLSPLRFLRATIFEALRLYPPVWIFLRKATAPFTLGEHACPTGTQIMISPWLSHRNPACFADPDEFRPERWLEAKEPAAFLPFGAGPRHCAGREFAVLEATLVLARILARARIELLKPGAVQPEPLVTLRPRGPVLARSIPIERQATQPQADPMHSA